MNGYLMINYELIRTEAELESLSGEWNALLAESAIHVPFLRHEYLNTWWQTRGGGEWPDDARLAVVAARRDGQLIGLAPFFQATNRDSRPALLLLGSIEISDYLDVISRPADLEAFLGGLLPFLAEADLPRWDLFDGYNFLEDSPTLPHLERAARGLGWEYTVERLQHSPHIPLPGDWETYLAGIDKKQRHEVRRKMRRLEAADVPTRWYIVSDGADIDAEADAFLELMSQDPEKQSFLTERMRRQMRESIRTAFEQGYLQLAFLEINGEKAAAYYNFDYENRIWVYNSGIDNRFREYSAGWVLTGYLLQWANENKRAEFDFLRGDEEYKYRFGAVDRYV
ncbi:MAG TPA: GNAT family N-acetyltransferase, partial [Anaerolineaceae bacterium]|nr:GNAT family N-acetyltransferase [Anaerolineaceae bacterium]